MKHSSPLVPLHTSTLASPHCLLGISSESAMSACLLTLGLLPTPFANLLVLPLSPSLTALSINSVECPMRGGRRALRWPDRTFSRSLLTALLRLCSRTGNERNSSTVITACPIGQGPFDAPPAQRTSPTVPSRLRALCASGMSTPRPLYVLLHPQCALPQSSHLEHPPTPS
ncbi:hypothetical protein OH76DRAFT_458921 [Lentinus brumalis]|uniref:Uncharacterized protein n=1 Tax=Lentinus brumalis TaxID=2498619 RepID=A0A371DDI4_9APHY|nr:hypothetical protein OH76DRAFT_458921 [Polyporus brumalis]